LNQKSEKPVKKAQTNAYVEQTTLPPPKIDTDYDNWDDDGDDNKSNNNNNNNKYSNYSTSNQSTFTYQPTNPNN